MGKSQRDIKEMSNRITQDTGQYMFTKAEIGKITGLSKGVVKELCLDIPTASTGKRELFYIDDVLKKLYNG